MAYTYENILEYANNVVKTFGHKTRAQKTITQYDDKGLAVGAEKVEVIMDRTVQHLFGFDIVFLEESTEICAIWFMGQLVFNTVIDEYDEGLYDKQSKLLKKITDKNPGKSIHHGDWEEALKMLSDYREKIYGKIEDIKAETDKTNKWIMDFNEQMLRFIPFKYLSRGLTDLPLRDYSDDIVNVVSDFENRDSLKVYLYLEGRKKFLAPERPKNLVFDYTSMKYVNGPWIDHVKEVMEKQKAKLRDKAVKNGFNPDTLEPVNVVPKDNPQDNYEDVTAEELFDKIKQLAE